MFVVDTNVLLYAANPDAPEHDRCRERIESWRAQAAPWYVTWGIVYEFLRVATHPHVFPQPLSGTSAWSFIVAVLDGRSARVLSEATQHRAVLTALVAEAPRLIANMWHDAHIVALMREHGIKTIITRDTHFHRFPGIEVVDPLAA